MVFKEVLREYDRLGNKAKRTLEDRKQEVYSVVPRIKEIDDELSLSGIRMAKSIIGRSPKECEQFVEELQNSNEALIQEKNLLLRKYKYATDYLTNAYECSHCRDTGFIDEKRCACMKQKIIKKYYEASNLSNVLEDENFDTFNFGLYPKQKNEGENRSPFDQMVTIHKACFRFVNKFDEEYRNLLFYGMPGLGKTFMCNCIAKDLLDRDKTVLYTTAPKIFEVVSDLYFNKNNENMQNKDLIDFVYTADLLIIDDLGTEVPTIFTTSQLFNFINSRLLEKRHTIISTNLSFSELKVFYSERITSRILGNCMSLHFLGSDIRQRKKYKSEYNGDSNLEI